MTLADDAAVYAGDAAAAGFVEVELGELIAREPRYFVERSALEPYATHHEPSKVRMDQFFCAPD